jgi:F-type H+-transporting ATPase subunit alpha
MPVAEQIAVLLAATEGLLDDLEPTALDDAAHALRRVMRADLSDLAAAIAEGDPLSDDDRVRLTDALRDALTQEAKRDGDA